MCTVLTKSLWPSSVAWHVPEDTSHILIFSSQDADTIVLPLGANSHAANI
jgi:hypothetical protein